MKITDPQEIKSLLQILEQEMRKTGKEYLNFSFNKSTEHVDGEANRGVSVGYKAAADMVKELLERIG